MGWNRDSLDLFLRLSLRDFEPFWDLPTLLKHEEGVAWHINAKLLFF